MVPPSLLKEYNNDAGDLNKKDVLKALYPPAEIPKEGKNSALATLHLI
jgi:hypothetical protein